MMRLCKTCLDCIRFIAWRLGQSHGALLDLARELFVVAVKGFFSKQSALQLCWDSTTYRISSWASWFWIPAPAHSCGRWPAPDLCPPAVQCHLVSNKHEPNQPITHLGCERRLVGFGMSCHKLVQSQLLQLWLFDFQVHLQLAAFFICHFQICYCFIQNLQPMCQSLRPPPLKPGINPTFCLFWYSQSHLFFSFATSSFWFSTWSSDCSNPAILSWHSFSWKEMIQHCLLHMRKKKRAQISMQKNAHLFLQLCSLLIWFRYICFVFVE